MSYKHPNTIIVFLIALSLMSGIKSTLDIGDFTLTYEGNNIIITTAQKLVNKIRGIEDDSGIFNRIRDFVDNLKDGEFSLLNNGPLGLLRRLIERFNDTSDGMTNIFSYFTRLGNIFDFFRGDSDKKNDDDDLGSFLSRMRTLLDRDTSLIDRIRILFGGDGESSEERSLLDRLRDLFDRDDGSSLLHRLRDLFNRDDDSFIENLLDRLRDLFDRDDDSSEGIFDRLRDLFDGDGDSSIGNLLDKLRDLFD